MFKLNEIYNTYTCLVNDIDDADELAAQWAGSGLGYASSFHVSCERLNKNITTKLEKQKQLDKH